VRGDDADHWWRPETFIEGVTVEIMQNTNLGVVGNLYERVVV
jgi:hypothetical protein